jgi:hypothetical protein
MAPGRRRSSRGKWCKTLSRRDWARPDDQPHTPKAASDRGGFLDAKIGAAPFVASVSWLVQLWDGHASGHGAGIGTSLDLLWPKGCWCEDRRRPTSNQPTRVLGPRFVTAVRNCPLDRRLWRRPMPYRCTRLIMVPVSDQGRHEHVLQLRGASLLVGTNRLLGL